MFESSTLTEQQYDSLLYLRKSIDDLTDQMKELNQKLPKSYEIEDLVKSIHKLVQLANKQTIH